MGTFGAINKWSIIYGVEYKENILGMAVNQNAMCAVCQSRRANKVRKYINYLVTLQGRMKNFWGKKGLGGGGGVL